MDKKEWNFLNTLPSAVRKKTTDALKAKSDRIKLERTDLMIVEKTDEEVNLILADSENFKKLGIDSTCLCEYYSTLDGIYLLGQPGACNMYKTLLTIGDDQYAATVVTAYHNKEWKSIIDL